MLERVDALKLGASLQCNSLPDLFIRLRAGFYLGK